MFKQTHRGFALRLVSTAALAGSMWSMQVAHAGLLGGALQGGGVIGGGGTASFGPRSLALEGAGAGNLQGGLQRMRPTSAAPTGSPAALQGQAQGAADAGAAAARRAAPNPRQAVERSEGATARGESASRAGIERLGSGRPVNAEADASASASASGSASVSR